MKALLEYLATNLVDHPEAVTIKERTGRHTVTYQLTVAPMRQERLSGAAGESPKLSVT
jgi:predicted RNA-binding protein YlqC (UPF0109 family)